MSSIYTRAAPAPMCREMRENIPFSSDPPGCLLDSQHGS